MAVITFIIPKNSGLSKCRKIANQFSSERSKIVEVRGEDVPLVVFNLLEKGENVLGVTGEDLFKEFSLKSRKKIEIIDRIKWEDENALFRKPTLCLLGPKNSNLKEIGKNVKICVNSKYKRLAKKYLNGLENKGYNFEKIYVSGSSEELFSNGITDLIIEIVYSGKSAINAGLRIYDKIFSSNIVVIGGKK